MTEREAILQALAALLASPSAAGFFPAAAIDEPEPSGWVPVADSNLRHACAVQDGPPPDHLARVHGGGDSDELELEAAVAYAVQAVPVAGASPETLRAARRARRDLAVDRIAALIAANRTLGLGVEVWAEVAPAQRDDEVSFANAVPAATVIVPVRVLYTAAHAAG